MKPKKFFGQNFLIDKNKINSIIESIPNLESSTVVEVGPGMGAITIPLSQKAKKLIAIEIDNEMIPILKKKINKENFVLINKDVLSIKWDDILKNETNVQFISNLPYYISTKIMFKVAYDKRFSSMSIMLQKELVERIFSPINRKTYGRLTVSIGSIFSLEKKINVPAGCFSPKPNVDSGFIILKRKDIKFDIDSYLSFIKFSFAMKRKTFLNSLKKSDFNNVDLVKQYLQKNGIMENIRAEQIEINTFIDIYEYIKKNS